MSLCLQVTNIRVRSLSVDHYELTWEVASTSEDVLDYTFQVLRSEAPAGPFEEISPELDDRYLFIDNRLRVGNRWRQWHYVIRVRHKPSDETQDFGPASPGAEADLHGQEIRSHIHLLMREFAGIRCWLLPRRTFGQRCPKCWNETLKAKVESGCRTCYDTGFVRGYHSPIEAFIQIDPSPKTDQPTNIGKLQQSNTTARMAYFPPVKPQDLLIDMENTRWRVTQVSATRKLRAAIHQEIGLHEIPKSDTEYLINIDLGNHKDGPCGEPGAPILLRDLFMAGARNYTNPHTLENFENEETPGIFALYPSTYPDPRAVK